MFENSVLKNTPGSKVEVLTGRRITHTRFWWEKASWKT
jgi:hypothetical protein